MRWISRSTALPLLAAGVMVCCTVIGQSQNTNQKLDAAILLDAPNVPQMVVDSDGALHFGPRTVPPPALSSPESRQAYIRQMLQRAQTSAAKGGLAMPRPGAASVPPGPNSKETALKIYAVSEESAKIRGVARASRGLNAPRRSITVNADGSGRLQRAVAAPVRPGTRR